MVKTLHMTDMNRLLEWTAFFFLHCKKSEKHVPMLKEEKCKHCLGKVKYGNEKKSARTVTININNCNQKEYVCPWILCVYVLVCVCFCVCVNMTFTLLFFVARMKWSVVNGVVLVHWLVDPILTAYEAGTNSCIFIWPGLSKLSTYPTWNSTQY